MFTLPIGTIVASALNSASIPDRWLPCDGSQIPAGYEQLQISLGTSTTPNLIGCTLIGAGSFASARTSQTDGRMPQFEVLSTSGTLHVGDTGGECAHKLTPDELANHVHQLWGGNLGFHHRSFEGGGGDDRPLESPFDAEPMKTTDAAGGDYAHFNVQPYYAVTYIIYGGEA